MSFPNRRASVALGLLVVLGLLFSSAAAQAQGPGTLWWTEDGAGFATFGPNASVTIDTGFGVPGTCDGFFPATNIYVVNTSSIGGGASLTDVSNANGIPNTVFLASGGIFILETIGFTKPDGFLGPGTYGVVFDECQNGVFDVGVDTLFYPAFEVVIPANIGPLPPSSIAATKAAAQAQADSWTHLIDTVNAIEKLMEIKSTIECLSGGVAGCLASMAIDKFKEFVIEAAMGFLGLMDPKDAAKDVVVDTIGHYGGIAADPPDPNFAQPDVLEPVVPIVPNSSDPIINGVVTVGNAQATQAALLQALLHALERYQGADIAEDSQWALVHARAIQSFSTSLIDQIGASNAALNALDSALTGDPRNFDAQATAAAPILAQIVSSGFNVEQMQALLNASATTQQIVDLRASIAAEPSTLFTEAGMHAAVAALIAGNADLVSALTSLITDMDGNIVTLLAAPNLPSTFPVADAGGPYTGTEGVAVAFDAAGSTDPDDAIANYAWDMDRDGQFDDAVGVAPSFAFPAGFTGFVGLHVTDAAGHVAVAYALVTIGEANGGPAIGSATPADDSLTVQVGATQAFSVSASDPNGDAMTARWLVDFVEVANGASLSNNVTFNALGQHTVRVEVTDGLPAGGTAMHQWTVTALAGDADGDGWNANADCNDGNAAIHPFGPEIIGNGIDDDCRPETLDGGTPPTAAFTVPPGVVVVGTPITFTDNSTDPDFASLTYAWSFGDGGTSNQPNPTHTFATAGTFTVTLTVTDPQLFTSSVSHPVTATHLPVASFTFTPNPGRRDEPIQFTDTSTDVDGPIASRSWAFGDGVIANGANPTHAFVAPGIYPVTLTVTDGDGATATTSQMVTVGLGATDPLALRFAVQETNCGWGAVYTFSMGGIAVATLTPSYDCACSPGAPKTVEVTDPAVLALIAEPVCQTFTVSTQAQSYIGWARAEIVRASGVELVRIVNTNGAADPYSNQVCNGFGPARSFESGLPNFDGDAIGDCTDDDIDGDGVLNAADNCVFAPNAGQEDSDGNAIGNACQDTDRDRLLDTADNCPAIANTDQRDYDGDGIGNLCDPDADGDGVLNAADNCAFISNATQVDTDGNGHGDACDIQELRFRVQKTTEGYQTTTRIAIDGVEVATLGPDASGNCGIPARVVTITDPELLALLGTMPTCNQFRIQTNNNILLSWAKAEMVHYSGTVDTVVIHDKTGGAFPQNACYAWEFAPTFANATPDTDGDGVYNCEDPDMDSDGVPNVADNCPLVSNPGQDDVDGNGVGNACQDTDADTVLDINDNCPLLTNVNQSNIDGDSLGDVCDPDRDNDTVLNAADNCADIANTNQSDIDADGIGDVCDPDIDGDTVGNGGDNCPTVVNTNQRNTDGDSVGDACDPDIDNDTILNAADNCLYVSNAGQESTNPYGVGDSCVPRPITVPWLGVPTQPHQTYSGGSMVLQGIAVYDGSYAPADILSAVWDPGDGSPAQSVNIADPLELELTHTYTGAAGTPFTAVLTITMLNGATRSDEFRVLIQPRTLDVDVNLAIDRGLWNLHKSRNNTTVTGASGSLPALNWTGSDTAAASAATINAFGINNHKINGNRLEDPYVEDVRRGLAFLETQISAFGISAQAAGNPDTNGNGIGLQNGQQVYVTGQIADAFVAAAQQTSVAVAGDATWVRGRTHRDLVQDMMDAYWFGQADIGTGHRGGWHYGWNYGSADNSTAQWGAITGLAGENAWNIPVPQFVKDENILWVRMTQFTDPAAWNFGSMGYQPNYCPWSNCMATTPSGMVQMDFVGVRNDPAATSGDELRFQQAVQFMARGMRNGWHTWDPSYGNLNYYALFAMAKAFRLAVDSDGSGGLAADPVVVIDDNPADAVAGFDWYRNDPSTPSTSSPLGVARALMNRQNANGSWPDTAYWGGSLATAYSVIILSPTIFELGPAAICSAVPSIAGVGDTVSFDGSGSVHNDPFGQIASYTWEFQDGSEVTNAAPVSTATHAFGALGNYNVLLTVTDQNGITAAASCPVQIIEGNRPPIASAGGPYHFCAGGSMVLNASASTDPEGGALTFAWDLTSPLTFTNVDGTTAVFDATSVLASLVPGVYQIGLRVTDDHAHAASVFPNITIHAADDADYCNTPPVLTLSPNLTTYATSAAGAQVSYTVTASDPQQGNIPPVCAPASNTVFEIGTTTVECTVTDDLGLTDTGSFTVMVLNNPPAFTPPANIERVSPTAGGVTVDFTANGNDIEDGVIPATCVPSSGSTFLIGSTTVNCTVTDSHGAVASGSFQVIVSSPFNVGPSFTPPANISTSTTNAGGTAVSYSASGTDPEDGVIPAVCSPASGANFVIGTTTVNCTVTDSGGLSAAGLFTVAVDLVVTNNPPAFTPPPNRTVGATSAAGAIATFIASGTDTEDGEIPAVCTPPSGSTFPLGVTTVHCTVTDSGGLTASGSFTINVTTSNKPPVLLGPRVNVTATSPAGAVAFYKASATDREDGELPASCAPPSGSLFPIGTTMITCSATDTGGLTTTIQFKAVVNPNSRPKLTTPSKIIQTATTPEGAEVTYSATATDLQDGVLPVSCSVPSGSLFPVGSTNVSCSATDSYGDTTTVTFRVTITLP